MKILIVSHNVFCSTSSMGKTLESYFKNTQPEELAQFYIHSEVPTDDVCYNYYRITDKNIIKSILSRKSGTIFKKTDIQSDRISSRCDTGITANIYQKARKKTPLIYFMRNLIWSLGSWKTKRLLNWIDEFNPDAVFFASGDYSFMYKIALFIAKYKKIPLFISCMDDYYFQNKNENRFGGKLYHKLFMKQVYKTMKYASAIFAICDKMSKDYKDLFNIPTYVLHTGTEISERLSGSKNNRISYLGNLGYQRDKQLIKLGQALLASTAKGKPDVIDVYSSEIRPEILKNLNEQNGIKFHGEVGAKQVKKIMRESQILIHTESFDKISRKTVAYSVSTKIADSLASGTCILAYGPEEIASIDYLKKNKAAYCITSEKDLIKGITELLTNESLCKQITDNAVLLAEKNHNIDRNSEFIKQIMEKDTKKQRID